MKSQFKVGQTVKMTEDALDNYGEKYRNIALVITHKATKYMPSKEFFANGEPSGFHPGYDESMQGMGLYDLKNKETGEALGMSLYDWELEIN